MVALRYAAILCASAALIPAAALAQTQTECQKLEDTVQQRQSQGQSVRIKMDQVRAWKNEKNETACRDAMRDMQTAGGQQQTGEPAGAQVTVQQPPAQVEIRQPQPEILVHQPAPKVTVEIPQPQITVRMPQPQAEVSQAQPQVQVQQAQPKVEVTQSDQQAQVQVQQGQPQVRYEAEEPQVEVKRAEGKPDVKVEQQTAQTEQQTAATGQQTEQAQPGQMRVSDLEGMELYNTNNEQIGEVERVIVDANGKQFAIVSHGGFLGLGDKKVALPLDNMWMSDDRLMIRGLSDEEIKALPTWDDDKAQGVRELEDDQTVQLPTSAQ